VPMLYPGSTDFIPTGSWIPNWCLWLVLEIEEYAHKRGGDPALVSALKDTVYGILGVYKRCTNAEGFAEEVPGCTFVEWSRANDPDVVCGVNYPTNMLLSGALEAAGRTYNDSALIEEAAVLRERIREYSFNGRFFTDNSVRENGVLRRTSNTTEVCQYYAVFFGIASAETHPELLETLTRDFGPQRKQNNLHPDVPFANAFIGNYLRLDSLMRLGYYKETAREIAGYFGFMARANGALWEYDTPRASCCHGFASMAAVWIRELKKKGIIK